MIKAFIFDFAGVIGADGYWIWLREKLPELENKKTYFQEISEKVDRGDITNKKFVELIAKATNASIETIWKEIYEKITINKKLLNYIEELKKKYTIGLLSNFTFEWIDELFLKHNLSQYFEEIIISSRLKIIKPDPKIFEKMINLLKIDKSEAVFIDDRQYNVDAANKFGIKSLLFISNDKLKKDIKNLLYSYVSR